MTSASRSWESYGLSRGELVDEPLLTFVHPDDRVAFEPYLLHPVLAQAGPVVEIRFARTNGWVSALARIRLSPDEGTLILSVFPVGDVMARTVEAERRAAEQLATVGELRNRLIEATSHELRTPLTVISGFAETLQRTGLAFAPDDLRLVGASIQRHALRLERIIGDLIDLDRSAVELSLRDVPPCNVAELVQAVLRRGDLGDRQVHASVGPAIARVDRSRFRRAVEQLLDNVRRHTPNGTDVWLELTATDTDILLVVSDDGPGLPDEVSADAFSAFAQGPVNGAAPGLGLGLAVVQRCAELHGGQCWYTPREGGGSRFALRLPRDPTSQHATAAELPSTPNEAPPDRVTGGSLDNRVDGDGAVADSIQSVLARARQELGMRIAYLSELTPTEQVVIGTAGDGTPFGIVPGLRLPLEETFCARMLEGRIPNAIPDTADEPAVAALASARAGLAAYVGVPVHLPSGHVFGTLCCADDQPRPGLDNRELSALRALAGVIGDELGRRQVSVDEQRQLTARIEQVLRRRDGLNTLYQPIARLSDGRVAGVEALSRFPDNQLRPPDVWFADAARVGLAGQLEQTAALRALTGLSELPDDCYLSINFSPDAIHSGGLRPLLGRVALDRIVIEITEHASIADYDRTAALLRPFRDGGARLAIDDVGAGFSSLRHVLRMGPEIIKLDRSLVANVAADPAQRAIASAFGELAHRLDASVVAEGIEDSQTRVALIDAGVTHGQGWHFDRPGRLPLRTSSYGPPEVQDASDGADGQPRPRGPGGP